MAEKEAASRHFHKAVRLGFRRNAFHLTFGLRVTGNAGRELIEERFDLPQAGVFTLPTINLANDGASEADADGGVSGKRDGIYGFAIAGKIVELLITEEFEQAAHGFIVHFAVADGGERPRVLRAPTNSVGTS